MSGEGGDSGGELMEPYTIAVVFGQRHGAYPGQYAPEVLDAIDEYSLDENPAWLEERVKEHVKNSDLQGVVVVKVTIPRGPIDAALNPPTVEVRGEVG